MRVLPRWHSGWPRGILLAGALPRSAFFLPGLIWIQSPTGAKRSTMPLHHGFGFHQSKELFHSDLNRLTAILTRKSHLVSLGRGFFLSSPETCCLRASCEHRTLSTAQKSKDGSENESDEAEHGSSYSQNRNLRKLVEAVEFTARQNFWRGTAEPDFFLVFNAIHPRDHRDFIESSTTPMPTLNQPRPIWHRHRLANRWPVIRDSSPESPTTGFNTAR
jgi:hypothetical protein